MTYPSDPQRYQQDEIHRKEIGTRCHKARLAAGLKLHEAAGKLAVPLVWLEWVEIGKASVPTESLWAFSAVYSVSVLYFLGLDGEPCQSRTDSGDSPTDQQPPKHGQNAATRTPGK